MSITLPNGSVIKFNEFTPLDTLRGIDERLDVEPTAILCTKCGEVSAYRANWEIEAGWLPRGWAEDKERGILCKECQKVKK